MVKQIVHLIFPQQLIKEPVIYSIAKKYNVIPNIRRANITEKIGEVTLEISGTQEDLEKALTYLKEIGVKCEPVIGDIVE